MTPKLLQLVKLSTTFALSGILVSAMGQSNYERRPNIYAVVVGISGYSDKAVPALKFGEKDANDFYQFLLSPSSGSIPKDNITLLTGANATRENIIEAATDQFMKAGKEDMIIFYFSGHGKSGETDNAGYLLGYDYKNGRESGTAVEMGEIKGKITESHAKIKLSYVDACHAGLFSDDGLKGTEAENQMVKVYMDGISNAAGGTAVFMASKANQQSEENVQLNNGVFTHFLIRGLMGEADASGPGAQGNNDKIVTVGEMDAYLTTRILTFTKSKQEPLINYTCEADFPLSVLSRTASLPALIAKAPGSSKAMTATTATAPANKTSITPQAGTDMPRTTCLTQGWAKSQYVFTSEFKEPLLLTRIYGGEGWGTMSTNILIPAGGSTTTTLLGVGPIKNNEPVPAVRELKFYFKTIDESAPFRYGTLVLKVEACKIESYTLSPNTFYISKTGEH
jgi:hypothetical protein